MNLKTLSSLSLHLVGCGKMGSALLEGWLKAGLLSTHVSAKVATEHNAVYLSEHYGVRATNSGGYGGEKVVILAVKPQILKQVIAESWTPAPTNPLYVSVAAGTTLASLQYALGPEARIIRAMPNTPALVGEGMTTLVMGTNATDDDHITADVLFSAVGEVAWMADEDELVAATTIAGSGPAYVFYFAECLMNAGRELGLSEELTRKLVVQTLKGSVSLADAQDWEVASLRQNVTSPGGVTEAALKVMMAEPNGLRDMMVNALHANAKRAEELD